MFHVSSPDCRKAVKPMQRDALISPPSLSFLTSLTMWRRISEVMGYRIGLAPFSINPFSPSNDEVEAWIFECSNWHSGFDIGRLEGAEIGFRSCRFDRGQNLSKPV